MTRNGSERLLCQAVRWSVNDVRELNTANFVAVYRQLLDGRESDPRDAQVRALRTQAGALARKQTRRQVGASAFDQWCQAERRLERRQERGRVRSGSRAANELREQWAGERRAFAESHGAGVEPEEVFDHDAPTDVLMGNLRYRVHLLLAELVEPLDPDDIAEQVGLARTLTAVAEVYAKHTETREEAQAIADMASSLLQRIESSPAYALRSLG